MPALQIQWIRCVYTPNKIFKILISPHSNVEWLLAAAGREPSEPDERSLDAARYEWANAAADDPDACRYDTGADDEERHVLPDEGSVYVHALEWPNSAD